MTEQTAAGERSDADPARAAEVFYDGGCPICRREIDLYKKMAEPELAFRDVSEAAAAPDLERSTGQSAEALMARFHARRADGRLVSGAAAFFAVWRATPKLSRLGRLLDRQPFIFLGDVAYAGFLWIRPLWRR